MKKIDFRSQVLPHVVVILAFLIITVIFYQPVIFESKGLEQHDILQSRGAGKELTDFRDKTGEEGLWTNSMFGGMPAYLISMRYSGDLIQHVKTIFEIGLPHPAATMMSTFICCYIMLLVFGIRPYLAMAGAIAYAFTSFSMVSLEAGHNAKVLAMAYMPLVIAGVHLTFQGKWRWGFLVTAIAMSIELRVNHPQITYYLLILLLFYGVNELIQALKNKEIPLLLKRGVILVVAVILAVGVNFGRLWGVYEYSQFSTRGKSDLTAQTSGDNTAGLDRDYVFNWSNGISEPLTLLIPNYLGGASQQPMKSDSEVGKMLRKNGLSGAQLKTQLEAIPTYWGDQPITAGPSYAGAILVAFFILGAFICDRKTKVWILAAVAFSIILSWGKNFEFFNYAMYDYFPMYSKFRSVSMTLSIALVLIPLLGMLGIEKLVSEGLTKNNKKATFWGLGLSAGFCLLLFMGAGLFSYRGLIDDRLPEWFLDALRSDRKGLLRADAMRSFAFILAAAVAIYFYLQKRLNAIAFFFILNFLVLTDLWLVDHRYLTASDFSRNPERSYFAETPADKQIKQDNKTNARVLNLQNPWNESRTSWHHSSLGGYHGAKMRRYQELLEHCLTPEIQGLQNGFATANTLNMLNTGYFITSPQADGVIKNPEANGRAWFVSDLKSVNNADEELLATCQTNAKETAIIDASRFKVSEKSFSNGSVQLVSEQPNQLQYKTNATGEGLVLFSEIYYPLGWQATIDGQPADILRANYVLRALEVPAGEHEITFTFEPQSYVVGNKIMLGSSILLILTSLGLIFMEIRKTA